MFNFDTSKYIGEPKRILISPNGWINPIEVEYGLAQANEFDTMTSVVWHVVGTRHFFSIYEPYMARYAKDGNYAKHFKEILERFRDDYLSWWQDEQYNRCEWRDEYKKEFERFIIQTDKNNKRSGK